MLAIVTFTLEKYKKTHVHQPKKHLCNNMVLEEGTFLGVREKAHSYGNLCGTFI